MRIVTRFKHIHDLYNWINNMSIAGILESERDFFSVQCPDDAIVTVNFNVDDDIDDIVYKTIKQFNDFDADERFTELWDDDFARHNHFTPSRFIDMLKRDEQFLHETARVLHELQFY